MKPGKTLTELAIELDAQNNAKKDYILDTRSLIMDADENGASLTMVNDKTNTSTILGVNDIAHSQIATALGIPKAYYEKMQQQNPVLLAENVNAWFNNEPKTRMVRTLYGDARAFLSDRYHRIDNYDLANQVLPMLQDLDVSFESNEVTDSRMYIKVVNKRITKEVKPGDFVQSGIIITNSEVGLGTVTIQPLLYRLVCTNGMVVNAAQNRTRRRHIGKRNVGDDDFVLYADDTLLADDRALLLKIRDTIHAALDEVHFTNLVDQMRAATEVPITTTHIPEMVQLAAPEFGFSKHEGEGILDHLIRGGDLSLYGFSNAVTRYAQDVSSYDRSTELEAIGYNILTMNPRLWKRLQEAESAA
jgi:phage terminase large subunit-like protein